MPSLLQAIIEKLERGDSPDSKWPTREGEYWARCPYHDDDHASNFSVSERGYHCFACGAQGGLKALAEKLQIETRQTLAIPGCTLQEYADAKKLPEGFLEGLGLHEVKERRGDARVPVLYIPYKGLDGKLIAMRRRQALKKAPDGTDNRFLWRKGDQLAPYGLWRLDEAQEAGWILLVEGESDAHTAWLHHIPCLGIPGANNWRREWIGYLKDLQVYIWREPDRGGEAFVSSLSGDLSHALVLPAPEGVKDLSDAHIQGRDVRGMLTELQAQAKSLPQPTTQPTLPDAALEATHAQTDLDEEAHYELTPDNDMVYLRPKPVYAHGQFVALHWERVRVANFGAQITHEVQRRDGEHVESLYTVAGRVDAEASRDRAFTVDLDGDAFRDERKARGIIGSAAGARAIIYQPRHFPLAIQELSNGFQTETRFLSTGWQIVDSRLTFVTPGSGIGYCEVSEELKRYSVAPGDTAQGLDALLHGLLEAFPHSVTYFAVAHAFLGPLYHWMTGAKRYVLHLVGETGSLKTSYACALLCLYGPGFVDEEPTEKWSSTTNKIERLGHEAKDVLYLVDDYKGRYVRQSDVTTLIQNFSESRGRGRLNRDATIKQTYHIRGALLSTGEDIPEGEASVISRMLILRLARPAQGANEALRYAQEHAAHLNAVMDAYTRWLAEHASAGQDISVDRQMTRWRDEYMAQCPDNSTNPGRLATNLAQNKMAWAMLGRFLQTQGVWDEAEIAARNQEYDSYALDLLRDMAKRIQKEKASNSFLTAIRALVESGEAELLPRDQEEAHLGKEMLGWKDSDYAFLLPDAAFHSAEKWYRSIGQTIGFSRQAIENQLLDDGVLVQNDSAHMTAVVKINNKFRRVLRIRIEALQVTVGDEEKVDQGELPF